MSDRKTLQIILGVWLLAGHLTPTAHAQLWADLVLHNGKILTVDHPDPERFAIAEAVAIFGDRIVGVGSSREMLGLAGPKTRRIDLEGKTVWPGRIDTHAHIHNYAARRYLGFSDRGGRSDLGITDAIVWNSNEQGLAELRAIVMAKKSGDWAIVQPNFTSASGIPNLLAAFPKQFVELLSLAELDRIAPNVPLMLTGYTADDALVNSLALEPLLQRFPNVPGVERDKSGKPTGRVLGAAARTLAQHFWPDTDPAWMAEAFRKYGEHYTAMGVTTVSSRIARNPLRGFQYLDARGQMSVRVAHSSEAMVDHPDPEMMLRRYDAAAGAGSPMLWNIGFSLINIDITPDSGGACYSKPYPRESEYYRLWRFQFFGPRGNCMIGDTKNHTLRAGIEAVVKLGGRIAGVHVAGDAPFDEFFDVIEPLAQTYNIRDRGFGLDHTHAIRPDQIERGKKLGIRFSLQAPQNRRNFSKDFEERPTAAEIIFGPEMGGEMASPFRSLIDAGLRPSLESDIADYYSFLATEQLITRRFPGGKVLGPRQAITKREALYASTRWPAEYVLREKELGSIETGKWADLVVLDRDYLTIPNEEIRHINVLLTVLGGKIVYADPNYAAATGLPQVGFRGSFRRGPDR